MFILGIFILMQRQYDITHTFEIEMILGLIFNVWPTNPQQDFSNLIGNISWTGLNTCKSRLNDVVMHYFITFVFIQYLGKRTETKRKEPWPNGEIVSTKILCVKSFLCHPFYMHLHLPPAPPPVQSCVRLAISLVVVPKSRTHCSQ